MHVETLNFRRIIKMLTFKYLFKLQNCLPFPTLTLQNATVIVKT